jgi:O-antigen/teichoic acid export membrane protein
VTDAAPASLVSRLRSKLAGQGVGAVLVRGATGSAGAHATGALLALGAQLVLARLLGVSQYGYYVYAFTWVTILAQICRLGFQTGLIRFTASYRTSADWAGLRGLVVRSSQLVVGAAALAALGLVLVVLALAERLPTDQVQAFALAAVALVPLTFLGVTQGILQGYRKPARALLPFRTFVHGGTLMLALLAAVTTGLSTAPGAMALTLVATVGSTAIAVYWVYQATGGDLSGVPADYRTRYWVRASLPLLLLAGMQVLMKQTDTAMLGAIVGTDAAGLYFPVARMSELAAFGLLSANAIVAPLISELHTSGDRARLQRLLTLAAMGTSAVTVAAALGFWLLGEWVLGLFGAAFVQAYPALMILLAGQVVNALCGPVGFLMTMTGHQDRAAVVLVGGALLNVALNATLIPLYGLVGAATATAISVAFWNLWMLVEVVRRHRLNPSVFARWPRVRL